MLLVVDNGSVYTDSIIDCLKELGTDHLRIPFDRMTESEIAGSHSIILSGRRQNNSAMNATNSRLIKYALAGKKPLLGICYGAEILAITLGGTIRRMVQPRHGIYKAEVVRDNPLCKGTIQVFESHSYRVAALDPNFVTLARSDDAQFEFFRYANQKIFGTQFHPEMSSDGKKLLENFASLN